jgi:ADP-heptose:LPS heptosyltransferase
MNILLTQLFSNGDCLLTTPIAKQIKEYDYPNCHLTWLISERCKAVLDNNPYIDQIIEVKNSDMASRERIHAIVEDLVKDGYFFDKVFVFDPSSENSKYYYKTFRTTFFRIYSEKYGHKIKVSAEPLIFLSMQEVNNVEKFAKLHKIKENNHYNILFECSPQSEQSSMNLEKALNISKKLTEKYQNIAIILSSSKNLQVNYERIIDASTISYRENAELLNYCHLLVGCSSGITWLNTTNWSKKIDTLQTIFCSTDYENYKLGASLEFDNMLFGLPIDNILEIASIREKTFDDKILFNCICSIIENGIKKTKKIYNKKPEKLMFGCISEMAQIQIQKKSFWNRMARRIRTCFTTRICIHKLVKHLKNLHSQKNTMSTN